MKLKFTKMHGIGNDFMVIDGLHQTFQLSADIIQAWSDRHTGIGFDQLLLVEAAKGSADFKYRIYNADGGEVAQCGNGARCFARFVHNQGLTDKTQIKVETLSGQITLSLEDDGNVTVNMGKPRFDPNEIPFLAQRPCPSYALSIGNEEVEVGVVSMGNPHAVVRVKQVEIAQLDHLGPKIAMHPDFPEQVNVGFMQVVNRNNIKLRVYERGVGETLACGTGACAAAVVGIQQGLLERKVSVQLPGGALLIQWPANDQPVTMAGSATNVFEGTIKL